MLKVLVVEDEIARQALYRRAFGTKVTMISAFTIEEATRQFEANPDLAAIVMDACVPGDTPTTLSLVYDFRETFKGPIIAASGDPVYRKNLMHAGCDHEAAKNDVAKKLLDLLGIPF